MGFLSPRLCLLGLFKLQSKRFLPSIPFQNGLTSNLFFAKAGPLEISLKKAGIEPRSDSNYDCTTTAAHITSMKLVVLVVLDRGTKRLILCR